MIKSEFSHADKRLYHYCVLLGRWNAKKINGGAKITQKRLNPSVSDSDTITMAVVAEFLGIDDEINPKTGQFVFKRLSRWTTIRTRSSPKSIVLG